MALGPTIRAWETPLVGATLSPGPAVTAGRGGAVGALPAVRALLTGTAVAGVPAGEAPTGATAVTRTPVAGGEPLGGTSTAPVATCIVPARLVAITTIAATAVAVSAAVLSAVPLSGGTTACRPAPPAIRSRSAAAPSRVIARSTITAGGPGPVRGDTRRTVGTRTVHRCAGGRLPSPATRPPCRPVTDIATGTRTVPGAVAFSAVARTGPASAAGRTAIAATRARGPAVTLAPARALRPARPLLPAGALGAARTLSATRARARAVASPSTLPLRTRPGARTPTRSAGLVVAPTASTGPRCRATTPGRRPPRRRRPAGGGGATSGARSPRRAGATRTAAHAAATASRRTPRTGMAVGGSRTRRAAAALGAPGRPVLRPPAVALHHSPGSPDLAAASAAALRRGATRSLTVASVPTASHWSRRPALLAGAPLPRRPSRPGRLGPRRLVVRHNGKHSLRSGVPERGLPQVHLILCRRPGQAPAWPSESH
ncbi:hypothetical protein Ga0074812_13582 [Parafrankia irregularis]|uniref:Uncharacterized protein n=1 Tax=Parafrankia irregularis TaxID=795642 RepID=A0A0S4QYX9_9ACTN|nr:hypothetical protein Ga0074812_13582 [Parafrankia irregularis]